MSTKQDQRTALANAAARLAEGAGTGQGRAPEGDTEPVRIEKVRTSLHLSPVEHRSLQSICAQLANQLGEARVGGAEVLRVLLGLAGEDPQLLSRVRDRMRATGGTRRWVD